MKQMIQKMREDNKGFTLAELLVVVAIIAVLVAIAIPVFTAQLNESRYATDEANARSVYAIMQADYLSNGGNGQSASFDISDNVTAGTAATVTVTSGTGASASTNTFNFTGLVGVTFNEGTATASPTVVIAAWNDHASQTFGGTTTTPAQP